MVYHTLAVESTRVMNRVRAKATALGMLDRIKTVVNIAHEASGLGNGWFSGVSGFTTAHTGVTIAPYLGGNIINTPSYTSDIPTIAARLRAAMPAVIQQSQATAQYFASNYSMECDAYEAGYELLDPTSNTGVETLFYRDPVAGAILGEYLDSWSANVGNTIRLYTLERVKGIYGMREFPLQARSAAPKWDATLTRLGY